MMSGIPEKINIHKGKVNQFFKIVGKDIIGSKITDIYVHNIGVSQAYSSYDDGTLFVIEYETEDGEQKCFSIGNGNIDEEYDSPISESFVFNNKETIHHIDLNCGCD